MTIKLVDQLPDPLRLSYNSLTAIIDAVKFQLEAWGKADPDTMDEDSYADLQNDRLHLETVLGTLEEHLDHRR